MSNDAMGTAEAVIPITTLAERWLALDRDDATRKEISDLLEAKDQGALESRLRTRISFGTAGLRASMKAGFAHMNSLTVLQASHGLADYLLATETAVAEGKSHSIVLGYDARHNSQRFAGLAAAALLSKGIKVLWFGQLVHTPMVPFAIRHFGASAGVMVTASHNPKQDNGYKVYWSNGSQIIPPHDAGIAKAIETVGEIETWDESVVDGHENVERIFAEATRAYLGALRELVWPLPSVEQVIPITYTPLHGVGLPFLRQIAHDMWFRGSNLRVVASQAQPDPDFPTVPFPNPEEAGALYEAIKDAEKNGISIVIANDPDADRFKAAERQPGGAWWHISGNEMGILLASHVFDTYTGNRSRMTMLATTVSSRMLSAMAAAEDFHFEETLTGFKWLGNVGQWLQAEGKEVVFAFEEAIGYMFPSVVWDKDGVAAAAVFLSAMQRWRKQGLTAKGKLEKLFEKYGYFADANTYLVSPSPAVTGKVFERIRTLDHGSRPQSVGSRTVERWRDLTLGSDSGTADGKPTLPVDASAQMLTCELEDVVFTCRGSGTEPKIKLYIEAKGRSRVEAAELAKDVLADLMREWFPGEFGLKAAGT
nr:hypothetical protein B0A51_00653 [Rachicladosporium sp. CCFEE 5018]